ncbi:MAG: glycoside hydrolase N-terminal domain-containing protein [Candidatus Pseudobacter hemicellulosilyticus]|uniref:Glycoside hydrolase N-terminal domain-containing protein n=1 Tax=Candidatus Pseudobacter hemicellulosilyticus TaxID=3121375 RepID=A0AAJ5WSM1_9BACT|nr:MAG: glycoside hydrolase N-terminal domain-containing protein [Pseudobacter sp.]
MKRLPLARLLGMIAFFSCNATIAQTTVSSIARRHSIHYDKPAPSFFEGALLGNGAMGVVVCTRPDAVVLYFGHNNVWDIRIAEQHREALGNFTSVFSKVKNISGNLPHLTDDPWYNEYVRMAGDNYSKPYPRPFPCGSVILGFDRRKMELTGHSLDISNGRCTVKLLTANKKELHLQLFTNMQQDELYLQLTDASGRQHPNIFNRIKLLPDPSTPAEFPQRTETEELTAGILSFRQVLPATAPGQQSTNGAVSRAFSTTIKVNGALFKKDRINWSGNPEPMARLEAALSPGAPFSAVVQLTEGPEEKVPPGIPDIPAPTSSRLQQVAATNEQLWKTFWSASSVQLDDPFLEQTWYRNLYFLNCATKEGVSCPGIFANWSYNNIGTAWHGDYHMNYNTQQPFWATFTSNHLEKNLPYVSLAEFLLPVSRKWAHDYYELPGAYFPHSAYPVAMTMNPYPLPDWGWEICETPWTVQGLWWHYLYSGDTSFLRQRAYEPIKAAVEFLVAYMKREDAHAAPRWQDGKHHIFPSVPPELYGLRPGFQYNYDCTADLSLTRFIFKAFSQATILLGTTRQEQDLLKDIQWLLEHFPEYPVASSAEYGNVLVAVPGEHSQVVYNVPNPLFSVFPGEDHGLHSPADTFTLLKNTYRNQLNEGGNDLVFINMQAARIGQLDLEVFKRHINYCLLPNGTAADRVLQTMGRYGDQSDFGYMDHMGIWFENFALPAVINECLLQSYNGTIRLFPNWPANKDASFSTLRAAGAFLVSATRQQGRITSIKILSEKGNDLRLLLPSARGASITRNGKSQRITGNLLELKTTKQELISIVPL